MKTQEHSFEYGSLIQVGVTHGNVSAKDVFPHPTTISKCIKTLCSEKRDELKLTLSKLAKQGVGRTTDLWTDDYKKNTYLAATIHFIQQRCIKERILDFKEITDNLTGSNIVKVLE